MLAKAVDVLPEGEGFLFEPKWDGFRAIVFRSSDDIYIQSRDLKPLDRYFPELRDDLLRLAAARAASSMARSSSPHPTVSTSTRCSFACIRRSRERRSSRGRRRRRSSPSTCWRGWKRHQGRAAKSPTNGAGEGCSRAGKPPLHLTPMTREHGRRGLAGAIRGRGSRRRHRQARGLPYQPGKRAMLKVKHVRTADCVVAGLPLVQGRDRCGRLAAARALRRRMACCTTSASRRRSRWRCADSSRRSSEPLRKNALAHHPWRDWADAQAHAGTRMPGARSRWTGRQGLVVGAAAHRARLRSEVRSSAGRSLSPRHALSALAARQAARSIAATTNSKSRRLTS